MTDRILLCDEARKGNAEGHMKILFIGGTGIISTACTRLALQRGHEVFLLNRGVSETIPGAKVLRGDIYDPVAAASALEGHVWNAVVDFLCYTPEHSEQRLNLFSARTAQYIFISSASAYQKPCANFLVTESTPLANPFWDYSRNKIACEDRYIRALREENFPLTIIRPSFTYGHTVFPLAINSWQFSYTAVDRMRRGLPVLVPGDGLGLWTLTHNTDFAKGLVGLLGHQAALGNAFHITSDEVLTWDQIYQATAEAAGVSKPILEHVASDFICSLYPGYTGGLLGDKSHSLVFDNTKIKRHVPDFCATTRYREGIRATVAWYDADKSRQKIDVAANAEWDKIIAAHRTARGK